MEYTQIRSISSCVLSTKIGKQRSIIKSCNRFRKNPMIDEPNTGHDKPSALEMTRAQLKKLFK